MDEKEIALSTIQRDKNTEALSESWVGCDGCGRWQHQICALFNQRRHEANSNRKYYCPMCLMKSLEHAPPSFTQPPLKNAFYLEQTNLGTFLEQRLNRITDAYRKSESEILKLPLDKVPPVPRLTLRVVATS